MRKLSIAIAAAAIIAAAGAVIASETITYSYDAKGRLVKVQHSGSVNNNIVSNYTFDKADNRATLNTTGAP